MVALKSPLTASVTPAKPAPFGCKTCPLMTKAEFATVSVKVRVPFWPELSITCTVKPYEPATVGVPLSIPQVNSNSDPAAKNQTSLTTRRTEGSPRLQKASVWETARLWNRPVRKPS